MIMTNNFGGNQSDPEYTPHNDQRLNRKSKKKAIEIEVQNSEKEVEEVVESIKRVARDAWFSALSSRGLKKIRLAELDFETWWKAKLARAKSTIGE